MHHVPCVPAAIIAVHQPPRFCHLTHVCELMHKQLSHRGTGHVLLQITKHYKQ